MKAVMTKAAVVAAFERLFPAETVKVWCHHCSRFLKLKTVESHAKKAKR